VVVGLLRIELALPANDSLKGKRAIVKKIVERAKSRFNVAAAEVGAMDVRRRAVLGFSVISNDGRHAGEMLDTIGAFVAGATEALVVGQQREVLRLGDEFGVVERTVGGLDGAWDNRRDD
jgi:uncharacterized protein